MKHQDFDKKNYVSNIDSQERLILSKYPSITIILDNYFYFI